MSDAEKACHINAFDIDGDCTGSSVMARMKKKLAGDRNFYRRLDKIVESIKMSSERTVPHYEYEFI